jgi:uncharacterized protein
MPCRTATRKPATPAHNTVKLHAEPHSTHLAVTAYGDDHVTINGRVLHRSVLLMPDRIDTQWGPPTYAALNADQLAPLAALNCDVLLLGTGRQQHFPPPALLRPLIEAGRAIEVMNTPAACRTYNLLVAEGRAVAAALIIEGPPTPPTP